ncbi:MAG: hypothetical protein ACRDRL_17350 [Sciscionella sp.]
MVKVGRSDLNRDVEGLKRVIRSRRTPPWIKPSLRISMRNLKTMNSKLAKLDELERELAEEIEHARDFVKSEFDKMHKEMIERFGPETEQKFAEEIERMRDVLDSKTDEAQREMAERIEHARGVWR